jgi:hypothetical protein
LEKGKVAAWLAVRVAAIGEPVFLCLAQLVPASIDLATAAVIAANVSPVKRSKQAERTKAKRLVCSREEIYPQLHGSSCKQFLTESKAFWRLGGSSKAKKKLIHSYGSLSVQ